MNLYKFDISKNYLLMNARAFNKAIHVKNEMNLAVSTLTRG